MWLFMAAYCLADTITFRLRRIVTTNTLKTILLTSILLTCSLQVMHVVVHQIDF